MRDDELARLRRYEALVAPGSGLREGLDRIVHGRTGALVVLGNPKVVQAVCTGGFKIDVAFTATALRELAKMDGAIVLSNDLERIVMAGVHLMPDDDDATVETGTRHRTAERLSRQCAVAVVTVSQSMSTIALFLNGRRHPIQSSEPLLARANQALQTLERYMARLLESTARLSGLEIQDQVTVRDLALVLQRWEMVRRLEDEIDGYIVSLGTDGRLVALQLAEAVFGLEELSELLVRDYQHTREGFGVADLRNLTSSELLDLQVVARVLGLPPPTALEDHLGARGYRQLAQIRRLPASVASRLIEHFGDLQALFGATAGDLQAVEGVGEGRARSVRDGLSRLADAAFSDHLG